MQNGLHWALRTNVHYVKKLEFLFPYTNTILHILKHE